MPDNADLETLRNQQRETNTNIVKMCESISIIKTSVAVLVENSLHTLDHCPMRVDIARAGNGANNAMLEAEAATVLAQKAINFAVENRVDIAKLAAMTVGGGISGGLIIEIIRYLMLLQ